MYHRDFILRDGSQNSVKPHDFNVGITIKGDGIGSNIYLTNGKETDEGFNIT